MRTVLLCLSFALACGCSSGPDDSGRGDDETRNGKPLVVVSTAPLAEFAERIGGESVEVVYPVPEGVDPSSWQPSDDDVRTMQSADVVLLNGAQLEGWKERVSLRRGQAVETAKPFVREYIAVPDFQVHSHGNEGEHSHPGTAPNTWLDPMLAIKQAEAVRETLAKLVPDADAEFAQRFEALRDELRAIDDELQALVADAEPRAVFASRPFCSYLGRRCGWEIAHLHWSPDAELTESDWAAFDEKRAEHAADLVVWPSPPSESLTTALSERGLRSIVIETGASVRGERNVLDVLRANLETVESVLSDEPAPNEDE